MVPSLWFLLGVFMGVTIAEPQTNEYLPPSPNTVGFPGSADASAPNDGFPGSSSSSDESSEPVSYKFSYEIKDEATGTDFGHSESRQGDVARGKYYVLLPDGRKQIVEYIADDKGYKPEVKYEGEPKIVGSSEQPNGSQGGYSNQYPTGSPAGLPPTSGYPTGGPASLPPTVGYPSGSPVGLPPTAGYPSGGPAGLPPTLGYPSGGPAGLPPTLGYPSGGPPSGYPRGGGAAGFPSVSNVKPAAGNGGYRY